MEQAFSDTSEPCITMVPIEIGAQNNCGPNGRLSAVLGLRLLSGGLNHTNTLASTRAGYASTRSETRKPACRRLEMQDSRSRNRAASNGILQVEVLA